MSNPKKQIQKRGCDARIDELRDEVLKHWIEMGYRVFSELDTRKVRLAPTRYRTYSDWFEAMRNHVWDAPLRSPLSEQPNERRVNDLRGLPVLCDSCKQVHWHDEPCAL